MTRVLRRSQRRGARGWAHARGCARAKRRAERAHRHGTPRSGKVRLLVHERLNRVTRAGAGPRSRAAAKGSVRVRRAGREPPERQRGPGRRRPRSWEQGPSLSPEGRDASLPVRILTALPQSRRPDFCPEDAGHVPEERPVSLRHLGPDCAVRSLWCFSQTPVTAVHSPQSDRL